MATQAIPLKATNRTELGSRANKRLRDKGMIPAVIYGHKEAVVPVTLPKKEVSHHLNHGVHVFDLGIGENKGESVLVKDIQWDHLGIEILHIDFARVSLDERVTVTVPIELKGEPKAAMDEGGVLTQVMGELEVECRVLDIPDVIRHNVSEMKLNDVLHVSDLKLPAGVVAKQDPGQIVASLRIIAEAAPEAAEAAEPGAAEPEVIGRKAGEEEGAEGEEKKGEEKKK
jgi:large subunit ribosomal protein L25